MNSVSHFRFRQTRTLLAGPGSILAMAACVMASGGAIAAPYNPSHLGPERLAQVAAVCQNTLGLRPSEPGGPAWGAAVNPGLTSGENHYQGCIAVLSNALRDVDQANLEGRVNQDCLARGLKPESPELAECVLRGVESPPVSTVSMAESPPAAGPGFPGSFFNASNREVLHREELACARLGLSPLGGAYDSCVKGLIDTFFAIDNPQS